MIENIFYTKLIYLIALRKSKRNDNYRQLPRQSLHPQKQLA
jgi:hypothetical protein